MDQNNSEVCAFVHYGYTPFSRVQCIKRLLFIWACRRAAVKPRNPLQRICRACA